jgi:hypothetical protein
MATSAMARHLKSNPVGGAHAESAVTQNGMNDAYSNGSILPNLGRPSMEERSTSMSLTPGVGNGVKARNGDSPWDNSWARAATRESSRSRGETPLINRVQLSLTSSETSLFSNKNVNEAKTGSIALLQDTDVWNPPWGSTTPSGAHLRSVGVSPVRRNSQMGNTQTLLENTQNTSQYFPAHRATAAVGQRPTNGNHDSNPVGQRHSEGMIHPYSHHTRSSDESSQPRNGINSWTDTGSLQSPTDERRGMGSFSASRENSLPGSRHGSEPAQFNQAAEMHSRFGQTTMPTNSRHNSSISSLSNGRFPLERQISQQSDYLPNMLGQMSIANEQGGLGQVRPHSSALSQQDIYARNLQKISNAYDEPALNNGVGSFTAEGFPAFQNPFQQPNSRFGERGGLTASASEFRQSPYHSTGTSSQVYDPSYSSHTEHAQPYPANYDELARRLRSLQQPEPKQQMMHHAPYQPTRMNPHQPRFRSYDAHAQYTLPMPMPRIPLQPTVPLMAQPGMYGMTDIPRGPRGEQDGADRIQSPILAEYKATHKSSTRRWELKVSNFRYSQHLLVTNSFIGHLPTCGRI